jgi:hypothetical protein
MTTRYKRSLPAQTGLEIPLIVVFIILMGYLIGLII